jgi:hypothetical protein
MPRMRALLLIVFLGCESKVDKLDKALDKLEAKVEDNKVSKTLDKLDTDEANDHLKAAKEAIGKGGDAPEACSWAARNNPPSPALTELQKLCNLDVPLAKATRAVTAAEKAKADQPGAPSYTECSSDEWAAARRTLDDKFASEPRWTDLKTRWTKVCPDAK